ncbi:MAG: hypothetical protein U1E76_05085 [Planctomycetota bacterium]
MARINSTSMPSLSQMLIDALAERAARTPIERIAVRVGEVLEQRAAATAIHRERQPAELAAEPDRRRLGQHCGGLHQQHARAGLQRSQQATQHAPPSTARAPRARRGRCGDVAHGLAHASAPARAGIFGARSVVRRPTTMLSSRACHRDPVHRSSSE